MQKWFVCLATLVCLATPWSGQAEFDPTDTVLEFETMNGVFGPYRGAEHPIRGIPGGVLPWVIGGLLLLRRSGPLELGDGSFSKSPAAEAF